MLCTLLETVSIILVAFIRFVPMSCSTAAFAECSFVVITKIDNDSFDVTFLEVLFYKQAEGV